MGKVLIITYYWPPGSGAGVQRWLKFAKYLPGFGWEPVILTVDPQYASYPAIDKSLEDEISPDLRVFRTRATDYFRFISRNKSKIPSAGFASNNDNGLKGKVLRFIRGNFFIPDPRKGWNRYAFRKACEIIESEGIRNIITTSPPHSTHLIGLKLKKRYPDIRWIADLRDPWTDIYYYDQFYPTFISKMIDSRYEKQVLKSADRIITVGKSLKDIFAARVPEVKDKTEVITNGFDEDDFAGLKASTPERFTISYIGTLSDSYPIDGFLEGISQLKTSGFDFLLKFVGSVSPQQKELILSKIGGSSAEFIPYVDHGAAIKYMLDASVLLLIIPDHKSNKSIITGKIFEYIATGKPIICLGPIDGDAAEILNNIKNSRVYNYNDSKQISLFLKTAINAPADKENLISNKFSRKNITSKLIKIMKAP
jgi:glycosyltransferase involved in cell wall biosynthesis